MTLVSAATLGSRKTISRDDVLNYRHLIQIRPRIIPYKETERLQRWFPPFRLSNLRVNPFWNAFDFTVDPIFLSIFGF